MLPGVELGTEDGDGGAGGRVGRTAIPLTDGWSQSPHGSAALNGAGANSVLLGHPPNRELMEKSLQQIYENEILCLQEEIQMLEQKAKETQINSQGFLKNMYLQKEKISVQNPESWKCSTTDLEAQVEQAKSQAALLIQLTGIEFRQHTMKIVGEGNNQTKQYRLSGYSHSLHFELEFELMDIQTEENDMAIVTDLNIILELNDVCDLSRFISRTEEKKSLLQFFRTISVFTKWYEYRQATFSNFKEKHPEVIKLPEGSSGDYMVLKCSKLPGIEFTIFWKIHVSEGGVVTPVLDLLTKVPAEALNLDTAKVMDNAPNSFRHLLHLHGIEAAIECLIQLCKEP
ncbi:centromere protein P [Mobula birostris]|uniref:centromere protein P n=1 Tax=Mobula birostris TaxID=1983395 RepID=UPI003B28C92F